MITLRAAWVLPVEGEPVADGGVVIDGHTIQMVGPVAECQKWAGESEILDMSDCAILPGLINAHTHLELSFLKDKVPFDGSFVGWILKIAPARRACQDDLATVIARACDESLAAGVTTVGDICFANKAWTYLKKSPMRKVCFAEAFGLCNDVTSQKTYLETCIADTPVDELLRLGLTPHAPYTAGKALYELAAQLAAKHHLPLTTHLAETCEEILFTTEGTGPLVAFLRAYEALPPDYSPVGRRPIPYFLDVNLQAQPFLLAHVNYLTDEELAALARTNHSVAYCPRSHRFFQHPPHRFVEMMRRGVNVCLGTDSLASNTSLSILDEMRFLNREFPQLAPATILRMATLNGAGALGWADRIGSLTPGKAADLIAIPLSHRSADPIKDILATTALPSLVMVNGQKVI